MYSTNWELLIAISQPFPAYPLPQDHTEDPFIRISILRALSFMLKVMRLPSSGHLNSASLPLITSQVHFLQPEQTRRAHKLLMGDAGIV